MVEEGLKWESRHLLQEVYENDSKLFLEPEKNCTDPGKTETETHAKKIHGTRSSY